MMEVWAVVMHFAFNGEDVSVWQRGKKRGYPTEEICKPFAAREERRWKDKWPAPTSVECEKLEIKP